MKSIENEMKLTLRSAFIVFLPFGTLAAYFIYKNITFFWASLASLLRTFSFMAFYSNLINSDIFWSALGLYVFILVSLPVYFTTKNTNNTNRKTPSNKVVFKELFKTVYNGIFSDYKISLLSKIPLAIQVLVAGSVLYTIFGLDWIMHAFGGFGVGVIALKAYKTGIETYGYNKLATYFGLNKFNSFKTERKWASAEWTLFCLIIITLAWELLERTIYYIEPNNTLRIGLETAINSTGDVIFGIIGGIVAWYLLERKLHWA